MSDIFAPDGVQYVQGGKTVATIYSPHKKSWIKYTRIQPVLPSENVCHHSGGRNGGDDCLAEGRWSLLGRDVLSKIELSNGYFLNFNYSQQARFHSWQACNHNSCFDNIQYIGTSVYLNTITDNKGNIWKADSADNNHSLGRLILPNGEMLLTKTANSVQGLTGINMNFTSNSISYTGANIAIPETDTYSVNGSEHIVTHTDGSKDVYVYLPSSNGSTEGADNHEGVYTSHKIEDKNGSVYYDEENTWTDISGVPVLTKQTITQDGVTTSKTFSDFNQFLYPQTIVETASNGETRTTKSTYFVLEASSSHGHMVKPATITVTDSQGKVVQSVVNTYDTEGYLTTSTVNGVTTTYSYGATGNIASETDANGNKTQYSNYINGQPQTVVDPNGNSTTYTYDYRGLMLTKTDPKGNVTTYGYDVMGRLISMTPPIGNPLAYAYNNNGLTVTQTQGQVVTTTNYDGLGRVINSTVSDGNSADTVIQVNKYDSINNRRFTSYPCREISQCTIGDVYTYDVLNRPIQLVKDTASF